MTAPGWKPQDVLSPVPHLWSAMATDVNEQVFGELVHREQRPAGTVLFGVPFDGAVPSRPGARFGPDAIRQELAKLRPWSMGTDEFNLDVADWGNVRVPHGGGVIPCHERTEAAALAVLDAGAFPLALGGDHSLTFPLVKAHEGRLDRVGVINLDAHLDVRDVVNGVLNSGQSFGRLMELGLLPGENYACIGMRDFANSTYYVQKARKAGATLVGASEWHRDGLKAIERAVTAATHGVDAVYLTVDMDVLDAASGPGVAAPTPGGPDATMLLDAVRLIAERAPLVGADVVETAPPLDEGGRTVRTAAYVVASILAGRAAAARSGGPA